MSSPANRISVDISTEDLQAIQAAVQVLQERLMPKLVMLGAEVRRELPKMGDKTVAFVRKAAEYARADAGLRPAYLDLEELNRDLKAVDDLTALQRPLDQISAALDDSVLAAGSDAYAAALTYYHAIKGAARAGVPGAEAVLSDLGQRFPGRARGRAGTGEAAASAADAA
jgi:hypothetical protein